MVIHWKKEGGPGSTRRMIVNGVGATATGLTTFVVLVAKFVDGAWVTALLIPCLILVMVSVRRHYCRVSEETAEPNPLSLTDLNPPIVVIPLDRWNRLTEKGLRFALLLSKEIRALHVHTGDEDASLEDMWEEKIAQPIRAAGLPLPELVVIGSPFRYVIAPVVEYVLDLERNNPKRHIAVLVPELVVRHWYQNLLHNKRANLLKLMLLLRGNQRILVINIPWYLDAGPRKEVPEHGEERVISKTR